MRTRTEETSNQAVSPLLGTAAAAAGAASSAKATPDITAKDASPKPANLKAVLGDGTNFMENSFDMIKCSQCFDVFFASSNANGFLQSADENFSITNLACAGRSHDGINHRIFEI